MTVDKIYDVLKSKYDVIDMMILLSLWTDLRNSLNYFIEFSFDDENIWAKLKFPEIAGTS